jgi:myosin heavy subunit
MKLEDRTLEVEELMNHFRLHGIRSDGKLKDVCRFQDLIMQSNSVEWKSMYQSWDQAQRRNFLWCCSCTLSPETMEEIIRHTIISVMRTAELDNLSEHWDEALKKIADREHAVMVREKYADELEEDLEKQKQYVRDAGVVIEALKNINAQKESDNITLASLLGEARYMIKKWETMRDLMKELFA